jgi:hypothetical protein
MASLTIPPHLKTCGRTWRDVLVALLPPSPRPPAGLTLDTLTRRSTPLTFAGRALTNRLLHLVVIGQPMGTLRNKVRAQPTTGL